MRIWGLYVKDCSIIINSETESETRGLESRSLSHYPYKNLSSGISTLKS